VEEGRGRGWHFLQVVVVEFGDLVDEFGVGRGGAAGVGVVEFEEVFEIDVVEPGEAAAFWHFHQGDDHHVVLHEPADFVNHSAVKVQAG